MGHRNNSYGLILPTTIAAARGLFKTLGWLHDPTFLSSVIINDAANIHVVLVSVGNIPYCLYWVISNFILFLWYSLIRPGFVLRYYACYLSPTHTAHVMVFFLIIGIKFFLFHWCHKRWKNYHLFHWQTACFI